MKPGESSSLSPPFKYPPLSPPPRPLTTTSLLHSMRMSCNGCRILRKGCSDSCTIRPCLDWINSPDQQANATLFLAKFYGRAGLINLLEAGPEHARPAVFRSLLYEACGRVVNPVEGSAGLLWSGKWDQCQAAVDAVLGGTPIMQLNQGFALAGGNETVPATTPVDPLKQCDIRHVSKVDPTASSSSTRARNKGPMIAAPESLAPSASGSSHFSNVTEEGGNGGEGWAGLDLTLGLGLGSASRS